MTALRVTYITAADSGVFDVDQDIVGVFQGGNWAVFEFDLVNALQDKGQILLCLLAGELGRGGVRGGSHLAIYLGGLGCRHGGRGMDEGEEGD